MITPDALIHHYNLTPHPEGGFYRRTYCSTACVPQAALPHGYGGARACGSAILYLLRAGEYSRLHRLRQDEMWHFYLGGPLRLVCIPLSGVPCEVLLGPDVTQGQHVQYLVPGGCWFGATPAPDVPFALVGCTVTPGFDFADFDLADEKLLLSEYPLARDIIRQFSAPHQHSQTAPNSIPY